MSPRPLRLVVLGMMGRCPFGGQTWLYLNWLRAFASLGHDVYYVEDDRGWPYDPERETVSDNCSYAVRHIAQSMERIGLANKWAYRFNGRDGQTWGMTGAEIDALYAGCDVLLNIVGATDLREEHLAAPRRVLVETDPVVVQLRLARGNRREYANYVKHHDLVTYGENYGAADCGVPLNGMTFLKTRQPVDLGLWPAAYDAAAPHFTTIGNYRQAGGDLEYQGERYHWSKHYEWEKFGDFPGRTPQSFELAVMIERGRDRRFLESHGWKLSPPVPMSLDIFNAYPEYIRRSRGAFTVAKDQNVRLRSGWFSEREACYLASGKPVVTQDTGFGCALPTGLGLFSFTTLDGAAGAIDTINSDYERHCRAAREIAEEFFSAPKVGAAFLRDLGLA